MKKALILAGFCLILSVFVLCFTLMGRQRALADKLIRFHVVASSDRREDQARKLTVRDALLEKLAPLSRQAESREEMVALLEESLPALKKEAEDTLAACGSCEPVEVTLAVEPFPTRYYDTFALPAGDYLSLRVKLGKAEGHNWWCVCFPTLCQSACTDDLRLAAAGAGFTEGETDWITHREDYELSFLVLEWLEKLRA